MAYDIVDKEFVEVFGGSGSIGLEALSRGAKKSYFIEKDKSAFKVLRQNIENIDKENSYAVLGDSFVELENIQKYPRNQTIFYFDPPFDFRDGMEGIYDKVYKLIENLPKEKTYLVAIEHLSSEQIPQTIGVFKKTKTKKFGKSSITYLS